MKKWIYIAAGVIVLFLAITILLAYATNLNDPLTRTAKKIYPAVFVGSHSVSLSEWQSQKDLAAKMKLTITDAQLMEQLTAKEEKEILAGKSASKNLFTTDQEYNFEVYGKQDELNKVLSSYYSNDKNQFVQAVVEPQRDEAILRIALNNDFSLNKLAYQRISDTFKDLNNGKKFEDLAKIASDDKTSGQLGGDLGFVAADQILPEISKEMQSAKVGEVDKNIIVSRNGYHIIYPVETSEKDGVKLWHLKHIYVQTTTYVDWFTAQAKNFRIWHLVKAK
jgi:parvulin-like peptidyl-prolyl isomerase